MSKGRETQLQYENALRNLNQDAWTKMNLKEKLEVMQYIENERAMIVGRAPCKVVVEEMDQSLHGEYRRELHEIAISKSDLQLDMKESVNNVLHESAHADQHYRLESLDLESATEKDIEEIVSLNMPLRQGASFEEYYNSTSEVDARNRAEQHEEQIEFEQQMIHDADKYMNSLETQNQILQTYDYEAIEIGSILNDTHIQEEYNEENTYSINEEGT